MKRMGFLLIMTTIVSLWIPEPAKAQSSDSIETVHALIESINAQDVEATTGLFADNAIATFLPAPPWGEGVRIGKDTLLEHFTLFASENGHVELENCSSHGATVVCSTRVTENGLRPLGLDSLGMDASITVHNGLVQSYHWTMQAESQKQLEKALTSVANLAIAQRFMEWANGGDPTIADEVISPDFIDHGISPGNETMDREGLKIAMAGINTSFDSPFVTEDIIMQGDKVVIRGKLVATHDAEFLGIPPTDNDLTHSFIVILRIEDGQIVERWANLDELRFLTQLGLIAPPGQ